MQFCYSCAIDTGFGKLSREASLRNGKKTKHDGVETTTYDVVFYLEADFGTPGAIAVKNRGRREFLLKSVTLEVSENRSVHFDCNSWVYPIIKTNVDRLFFANTVSCSVPLICAIATARPVSLHHHLAIHVFDHRATCQVRHQQPCRASGKRSSLVSEGTEEGRGRNGNAYMTMTATMIWETQTKDFIMRDPYWEEQGATHTLADAEQEDPLAIKVQRSLQVLVTFLMPIPVHTLP